MKKFFIITCLVIAVFSLKAQEEIIVRFTSTTQIGAYCPFNAVNVSNQSRGWDEVLYYPDTTLSLACSVGVSERLEISPIAVHPNPFSNSTNASFSLETNAKVKIQLLQLNGKEIASFVDNFEAGEIQIRVAMTEPQIALLVITTANSRQVAKILNVGNGNCNVIEATHYASKKGPDRSKANFIGDFMPGDTMRYEAVTYDNGNVLTSEIITKAQYEDETIVLEFVVTTPEVNTFEVSNITQTSALGGGEVTLTGGLPVNERGICWGTTHNPTINQNHNSNGSGIGGYSVNMNGLVQNTTYYVRAYAINDVGISYGQEVHFTTLDNISALSVTTSQVTNISQNTAVGGGNVTADGGANVTERGICWNTSHNPTINNSHGSNGSGLGNYTVNMTGLSAGTAYYVRAYAINSQGISYGQEVGFTTTAEPPSVTTSQVTNITQTSATGGGNVTSDGGATVTERGICWSTSHNPTTSGSHGSSGTGMGNYTVSMTGLTANTTYYVRAYATNSAGTAYGSEVSFTTLQNVTLPTITTNQVTNITETSATGGGNVTSDGGGTVTERGICWSTSHNPTTSGSHGSSGTGTGSFTVGMTGLTANTTYYVRAYATNNAGTAYGSEVSFTTSQNVTLPTVTTSQVTNITETSATGGGNVISDGGATVTERGICWSTSHNPTTSGNHGSSGTGTGSYTVSMTGLTANTTYYVRAYATNSAGTAYGSEMSFTTSQVATYSITVSANPSTGGSVSGSGTYQQGISCTVTAMANNGYTFVSWTENGSQVSTQATYTFIVTSNRTLVANFTYNVPTGAINGKYTINSSGGKVYFSHGNLQYQASTNTWQFAGNQYDFIGNANSNISYNYSGWIDLFGWGTSGWNYGGNPNNCYHPWDTNENGNLYGTPSSFYDLTGSFANLDWGIYNPISNGGNQAGLWRTMTRQEWEYVFNTRITTSGIRYAKAKVNNINGVILLPDNWSTSTYNLHNTNNSGANFSNNILTASQWEILENSGAVFLPAAGYRVGTTVYQIGSLGCYWSVSCCNEYTNCAYGFFFNNSQLETDYDHRSSGFSVRLVCHAN